MIDLYELLLDIYCKFQSTSLISRGPDNKVVGGDAWQLLEIQLSIGNRKNVLYHEPIYNL